MKMQMNHNDRITTKTIRDIYNKHMFLSGFIDNVYLRPSCTNCRFKFGKGTSDITLADFWGYKNYKHDDDKGMSAFFIWTKKGEHHTADINMPSDKYYYKDVVKYNTSAYKSCQISPAASEFWNTQGTFLYRMAKVRHTLDVPLWKRAINKAHRISKKLIKK